MAQQQGDGAIDVSVLRTRIRARWGSAPAEPDMLTAAAASARHLAVRAYGEGDRAARGQAESIIYHLNLESCFAPPAEPVAATVWTTLMQAKLGALRREFGGDLASRELSADEMQTELQAAVARWGAHNHPLLDLLSESRSLKAYRVWAKNWFGSCYGFSLQLASLVQRTTGAAKKAVLHNLNDEFDDEVTHDTLRVRFYESLGLRHSPEQALDDADWVLDSTELLNLRTGLCSVADPMPALGCFYGVEANWPPECRLHHAMNKDRGLDDHIVQYWTTHAYADEGHAEEWLEVVQATCRTGVERAAVLEGAVVQLRLRWRMYDAIRDRVKVVMSSG